MDGRSQKRSTLQIDQKKNNGAQEGIRTPVKWICSPSRNRALLPVRQTGVHSVLYENDEHQNSTRLEKNGEKSINKVYLDEYMHPLFEMDQYLIQEKFWKFFGGKFWFKDMEGNIVAYCKQKAFKLKEDIVLYLSLIHI